MSKLANRLLERLHCSPTISWLKVPSGNTSHFSSHFIHRMYSGGTSALTDHLVGTSALTGHLVKRQCTICAQRLYNVCSIPIQYVYHNIQSVQNTYTMFVQCLYIMNAPCMQYMHSVCTILIQCAHHNIQCVFNTYTECVQYPYNMNVMCIHSFGDEMIPFRWMTYCFLYRR